MRRKVKTFTLSLLFTNSILGFFFDYPIPDSDGKARVIYSRTHVIQPLKVTLLSCQTEQTEKK